MNKTTLKTCSRGHRFYKSSDYPVCPICWSGYYKKQAFSDFPKELSAPALRALFNIKVTKLIDLTNFTKNEILKLHGMDSKDIKLLITVLKSKNLNFKNK